MVLNTRIDNLSLPSQIKVWLNSHGNQIGRHEFQPHWFQIRHYLIAVSHIWSCHIYVNDMYILIIYCISTCNYIIHVKVICELILIWCHNYGTTCNTVGRILTLISVLTFPPWIKTKWLAYLGMFCVKHPICKGTLLI